MDIELRSLTDADLDAAYQLRVGAFSSQTKAQFPEGGEFYVPTDRRVGAFLDGRLVGQAAAWRFGQWLLGRRVPMAGIGGVIAAPDVRGRRVGPRLLRSLVDQAVAEGDVLAALYPSAPGFYRTMGWENGGHRITRRIPTVALRELPRPGRDIHIRPFTWQDDVAGAAAVLDAQARRSHGGVDRSHMFHLRLLEPDDDMTMFVAEEGTTITGVLILEKSPPKPGDGHVSFRQKVQDLASTDHDTWLALWHLVASNAPVCAVTTWLSSPADALLDHLPIASVDPHLENLTWMARVLDAPAAISARGWPRALDVEVHLHLVDLWLDDNDGDWVLRVKDGQGSLERGGRGETRLEIGAFSSLYTGYGTATRLHTIQRLATTNASSVDDLDEAFRSPPPYMRVYF